MEMDDSRIPSPERKQPHLTTGDFLDKIAPDKTQPVDSVVRPDAPRSIGVAHPNAEDAPTMDRLLRHILPSVDAEAAAHGAKRFQTKFADAEVQQALDRAAQSGLWYVTIHVVDQGMIQSFGKASDRFPVGDFPKCIEAVKDLVAKHLHKQRELIDTGLIALQGVNDTPKTIDDEED